MLEKIPLKQRGFSLPFGSIEILASKDMFERDRMPFSSVSQLFVHRSIIGKFSKLLFEYVFHICGLFTLKWFSIYQCTYLNRYTMLEAPELYLNCLMERRNNYLATKNNLWTSTMIGTYELQTLEGKLISQWAASLESPK